MAFQTVHQMSLYYRSVLMVAAAAALWGTIGLFVDLFTEAGFTPLQIVTIRVVFAFFALLGWMLISYRDQIRVSLKHSYLFIGTGILSICFFNWSYFTAIGEMNLSVAVVFLYTGPSFVVVMSRLFLGEMITGKKAAALLITLTGIVLVSELVPEGGTITRLGFLTGLGAGFGYALYSIFSKFALMHYKPITITLWTFGTATIFMLALNGHTFINSDLPVAEPNILFGAAGLGIFLTVIPYLIYTEGLKHIEAGRASIIAMVEPVAAAMIGFTLFGERLSLVQWAGVLLIMGSVILIQYKSSSASN